MKKKFSNANHVRCVFTDEGVTFCGETQDVYFPYGAIDDISLSLMGILQASHRAQFCTFAVDRKDRAEVKEMIRFARKAKASAEPAEVQFIDLKKQDEAAGVSADLSPEEQLKKYKMLFIQGAISKEEYDAKKRLLK